MFFYLFGLSPFGPMFEYSVKWFFIYSVLCLRAQLELALVICIILIVYLHSLGLVKLTVFFFMVLFITCFRLDTRCTYDCIGTSGKNCQNPHEGVLVKTTVESLYTFHIDLCLLVYICEVVS